MNSGALGVTGRRDTYPSISCQHPGWVTWLGAHVLSLKIPIQFVHETNEIEVLLEKHRPHQEFV